MAQGLCLILRLQNHKVVVKFVCNLLSVSRILVCDEQKISGDSRPLSVVNGGDVLRLNQPLKVSDRHGFGKVVPLDVIAAGLDQSV